VGVWKKAGLAAIAGVAATGVLVARAERQRRAYSPQEIRAKLRERLDEAPPGGSQPGGSQPGGSQPGGSE
jgi:hypothetical protein